MYLSGPAKFAVLGQTFSLYDLVLCAVAVALSCLFVLSVLQAARRLRREDRPAVERAAHHTVSRLPDEQFEISQLRKELRVSTFSS